MPIDLFPLGEEALLGPVPYLPVLPAGWESLIAGITVRPHVQAFADAARLQTRVQTIGTYPGHSPSADLALDLFVPTTSRTLGDSITAFAIANQAKFGVRYVIYRQHIWHRLDPVWRLMEDRGSPTQNHMDHVHVSFEAEVDPIPLPPPVPPAPPQEDEDGMKLIAVDEDRYAPDLAVLGRINGIFLAGENVGEDGKVPARHVGTPDEVTALVNSGAVANYDKRPALPASVFVVYYRVVG